MPGRRGRRRPRSSSSPWLRASRHGCARDCVIARGALPKIPHMRARRRQLAVLAAGLALIVAVAPATGVETRAAKKPAKKTRPVLVVSNNWDGTADFIEVRDNFRRIARLNIIPDIEERMAEIRADPERQGYFLAIQQLIGEGHNQYVDDAFTSPGGRYLYVSRASLADVVVISLRTRKIVWRVKVDRQRAGHMAISRDGKRMLVSASTAAVVDVIDTAKGRIVARFPSGESPHENNFSRDGKLIYHASIGKVYTPLDDPAMDSTKGERVFEIVDARTYRVLKRIDMGKKLAEAGHPKMSSAVRPMALTPSERYLYFQVSFFHGFVEYDLKQDKVLRLATLPVSQHDQNTPREQYVLDSAHHGLQMNEEGTKLCVAGTMDNYVAVVSRSTFAAKVIPSGDRPYWATNSADGHYCFVSLAGDDQVDVVSYATEEEVARIYVGDHPQRMRIGLLRVGDAGGVPAAAPAPCASRRSAAFKLRRPRAARIVRVAVFADGKLTVRRRG